MGNRPPFLNYILSASMPLDGTKNRGALFKQATMKIVWHSRTLPFDDYKYSGFTPIFYEHNIYGLIFSIVVK